MNLGIPYKTISQWASDYCSATFNDKRKFFPTILRHAKMIYKRLFWNTLRTTKSVYIPIDNTTEQPSIPIPKDCVRVYNIHEVSDCGDLVPYHFKENMNDIPVPTNASLVCNICKNSDDYSQYINNYTPTTKLVVIDGSNYYEKVWTTYRKNGDLVKIVETPVKKFTTELAYTIVYAKTEQIISKLDVEPCGCIKKTTANQEMIVSACGCIIPCGASCFNNVIKERVAKIRKDLRRIFLQNSKANYAILSYQTNGEDCVEEILIPEEADMAMTFGVRWLSIALNPNNGRLAPRDAKNDFEEMENDLFAFLNPLRINEFLKNQGNFYRWGGGYGDCDNTPGYNNLVKTSTESSVATTGAQDVSIRDDSNIQF